jgi:hypothetical protein
MARRINAVNSATFEPEHTDDRAKEKGGPKPPLSPQREDRAQSVAHTIGAREGERIARKCNRRCYRGTE